MKELIKLFLAFFSTQIMIFLILCVTIFYKYETNMKILASGYTSLVINAILWAFLLSLYSGKKEDEITEVNLQEVSVQN